MAAAAVQRKQHLSDDEGEHAGLDGDHKQVFGQEQLPAATAAAAKKLHRRSLYRRVHHQLRKLRSWLWGLIEELLEEFQPWLKWIIFDALLTLLVGQLVKHVEVVRPLFEAIGWA